VTGRTGLDLRLVLPAAVGWAAAWLAVAEPGGARWAAACGWCAAGVLVAQALAGRGRWRRWLGVAAVCLVAGALVAGSAALHAPQRQPDWVLALSDHGRMLDVLVTAGERTGGGARDGPFSGTLRGVAPAGRDDAVLAADSPVLVFGKAPEAGIGATLRFRGTLAAAEPEDDVAFLLFAEGPGNAVAPPPAVIDWANRLRDGLAAEAARLPGEGGDLLPGLAIGDTSAVGEPLDEAMKASSLSHLTAVSGANCAIIVGLVVLLGAAAGLSRTARIAAAVLVLAAFVVLVTPQASVVRASVMATIVLLAIGSGRPVRGVPVLSLAALVLLVADPWLSRDYGFALSVLATGGLLVLAPPLAALLTRWLPRWLATVVAVPLGAQLACQPVLLMLAPTVPLFGVVANVLAEPAAPLATVVGLLACVLLPVVPWAGTALAGIAWLPAAWIAAVAGFFAALPGAALPWPGGVPGVLLLAVVTAGVLVGTLAPLSAHSRAAAGGAALLVLVAVVGAGAGIRVTEQLSRPGDWQIAACDIGQGDAVLVRSAGETALIDTGPDPEPLEACLDTLGVDRIDLLVLSHFDLDHVGGTSAVTGRVVRALHGPPGEPDDERLLEALRAEGAAVEQVARGATGMLGELRWEVLWPRARLGGVEPGNDASVTMDFTPVGRCAGGCLSSLFLGDLGERSQSLVLAAGGVEEVDVVKVSHHGSADQLPRLYETAHARVGVISVGAENDYGHPTAALLDELARSGTTAARTDRSGLVLLTPGDEAGTVALWAQRSASGRRARGAPGPSGAAGRGRGILGRGRRLGWGPVSIEGAQWPSSQQPRPPPARLRSSFRS
jgi:competence protein ComEC